MLVIFLLIAILAAVVTLPADKAQPASWQQLFSFSLIMALDLALFIHVTVHHSPKPRWRWGKKPDDRPDEDF